MVECGIEQNPVAWVCPVVFDFPRLHQQIGFSDIVVDIVDDQRRWHATEDYKKRVEQNYVDILQVGRLVVSNCEPVQQGFRNLRKDIIVVPNGAEVFDKKSSWPLPADLADIPRPIIGYVGNLRDRVDLDAIREIAQRRPDWSVVLIGSSGGSLDVLALNLLPNVHLLGVRPYQDALGYIKNFDVAIMPHIKNSISDNMNPLKLYVYFALGVPVVTTNVSNIGDIRPYVSVADSNKAFIRAVDDNLKGKAAKVPQETRDTILRKVAWQSRVKEILASLKL
jgi:glycosyltransferase involved in cell wall biosynthesis